MSESRPGTEILDISESHTLPSSFYRSHELFEQQKESVFANSWQFITDIEQLKIPGQLFPFRFCDSYIPEPLLFTRDRDDQLHCLSNVCTHRGTILTSCAGNQKHLKCRYHGRRFSLDGTFEFMPEFKEVKGFPCESDNLSRIPFTQYKNFLFSSLNPRLSFEECFAPIDERIGHMPFEKLRLDTTRSRDYLVNAHWALYCDNYLEGFHIPYVHAGLASAVDYGEYRTEIFPYANLQLGVAKGGDFSFTLPKSSPDFGHSIAAYYFWVYPNLMLNVYPWGISVNIVYPISLQRTKVSFLAYVWDESLLDEGLGSELDRVEREDEAIVEEVQLGMQSRYYNTGRYSVAREACVHHFHNLLRQDLF